MSFQVGQRVLVRVPIQLNEWRPVEDILVRGIVVQRMSSDNYVACALQFQNQTEWVPWLVETENVHPFLFAVSNAA
jgi:hypothetical protein